MNVDHDHTDVRGLILDAFRGTLAEPTTACSCAPLADQMRALFAGHDATPCAVHNPSRVPPPTVPGGVGGPGIPNVVAQMMGATISSGREPLE